LIISSYFSDIRRTGAVNPDILLVYMRQGKANRRFLLGKHPVRETRRDCSRREALIGEASLRVISYSFWLSGKGRSSLQNSECGVRNESDGLEARRPTQAGSLCSDDLLAFEVGALLLGWPAGCWLIRFRIRTPSLLPARCGGRQTAAQFRVSEYLSKCRPR
jgi:hypothetical protein